MKLKFSNDFWWGTATSGPQTEGIIDKPNQNIMDYWYDLTPSDFFEEIGPNITNNIYQNYKNDIKLMSQLKLNSYRTSIQWTRLIEDLETNKISQKNYLFYRNYFETIKNNNIKLIVNLYHFDMPIKFQNMGGFENKYVVEKFAQYALKCFELFGDIVDYWSTFNEPIVPVEGCYLYKWYYPKIQDFKKAVQFGYGTLLAHAKVVNIFHNYFKNNKNKKISIILNLTPTYPKDNSNKNNKAAFIRDLLFNRSFLDPIVKNEIPNELVNLLKENNLLPEYNKSEIEEILTSKIDFLGINYYQPSRVEYNSNFDFDSIMPEKWFKNYEWENRRINKDRGWEIYPKAIYDIALNIKNNYKNIPWFISENGIGIFNESRYKNTSGFIEDDYRINFIKEHLYWLHKSINDGANCFGYHLWTFIDCWSWANAYKNRYGLVELDLKTQKRIIKKSGYWIKEVIEKNNEINIDIKDM